jgi:hypothetical protein
MISSILIEDFRIRDCIEISSSASLVVVYIPVSVGFILEDENDNRDVHSVVLSYRSVTCVEVDEK